MVGVLGGMVVVSEGRYDSDVMRFFFGYMVTLAVTAFKPSSQPLSHNSKCQCHY